MPLKKPKNSKKPIDDYCQMFAEIGKIQSVAFTYPDHLFKLFWYTSPFKPNGIVLND